MQHRIEPDRGTIEEYAALMADGIEFPPVRVWWDGQFYWLSDGFRRIEAAILANLTDFWAEIKTGERNEALWDSYAANATHGGRRTAPETERVILLALHHPNSAALSNVQIALHLHVAEVTVRRWRKKLSSSNDEDRARVVTRNGATYVLPIGNIGKNGGRGATKPRRNLRAEIAAMREKASPTACSLLTVFEHWVLGGSTEVECLLAIERVVKRAAGIEGGPHTPAAGTKAVLMAD